MNDKVLYNNLFVILFPIIAINAFLTIFILLLLFNSYFIGSLIFFICVFLFNIIFFRFFKFYETHIEIISPFRRIINKQKIEIKYTDLENITYYYHAVRASDRPVLKIKIINRNKKIGIPMHSESEILRLLEFLKKKGMRIRYDTYPEMIEKFKKSEILRDDLIQKKYPAGYTRNLKKR